MNSTELQCFVQVANTLSFIKAADKMSMSQPALSKQIMSLEDELGVKLFQRTTRRVQLTNAGKQFLKDAEDFLRMEINAKNRVEQYKNGGAYTLRIGYSESNILTRMDPVLYTVHKKYPMSCRIFIQAIVMSFYRWLNKVIWILLFPGRMTRCMILVFIH